MKTGSVIIFPTDTVYGMGTRLEDKKGLAKIFAIKERPLDKHIPILLPDVVSINKIATYSLRDIQIMKAFWPGELTVILKTTPEFKKKTTYETIALRIPDHEITLDILKEYGPLWTTSVNKSGEDPINDVKKIKKLFYDKVDKIYEEYDTPSKCAVSTIVDLTNGEPKILRQGKVTLKEINEVISNYEKDFY